MGKPPTPSPLTPGAYQFAWRGTLPNRVRDAVRNIDHSQEWLPSRLYTAIVVGNGFEWWCKGDVEDPPRDQVDFIEKTLVPLTNEIVLREGELGSRNRFVLLKQAAAMFQTACVSNPANPNAAAQQAPIIRKRMEEMLIAQQSTRLSRNIWVGLILAVVLIAVGLLGELGRLSRNLFILAGTCIATDAVMMRGLAEVTTFSEYEKKKHMLDLPLLRLLLLAIAVEIFGILCWKGGIKFQVGSVELQNFASDPWVAVVIGAAGGFLGSDLTRMLVNTFQKSAGRK